MPKRFIQMSPAGIVLLACCFAGAAWGKLPALSDEAKAKAAEGAAKTAHAGKVDGFQLCKAQDKVVAHAAKAGKLGGSANKPAAGACADPGPFAYTPAVPATTAGTAAPAPAAGAVPAKPVPVAPAKKS